MDVRDVGVALWRQRPLVVLVLLITGVAVVIGVLLAPKSYAATATLSAAEAPGASTSADAGALRAALAELAGSRAVVEEVRSRLVVDRSGRQLQGSIEAEWVRGTSLVTVRVEDRDPEAAAEIANAVAAVLVEGQVSGASTGPTAGPAPEALVLSISDPASPPGAWTSPDLRLAGVLGLLLALGLATSAAVLRERRTRTVDDAAGVEEAATAPVLAHLPRPRDLTTMPALHPGTAEADLFRHLRLAIERQAAAGGRRVVVVAGIASDDVSVWIGANLALALAGSGRRVLLVDGRMGERFGTPVEEAPDTPGLYDVLLGAELDTALSPGPVDLLHVLPSGTHGDVAIPELIAQRFPAVMDSATSGFDHVVVIGPPLEACEDSRVMAVESSILLAVVEASVSANALRWHADRLRAVGAHLLGVALIGRQQGRRHGRRAA